MKQRVITGLIMIAFMIPILIFGNNYYIFTAFCLGLSLLASFEFRKMFAKINSVPRWIDFITILMSGLMFIVSYITLKGFIPFPFLFIFLIFMMILYAFIFVFIESFSSKDFGNALTTIFYTSIGFVALAMLREKSLEIVFYVLFVAMLTDTFAYFIGVRFGKHKLAPKISPKKSIEGAVGGLVIGSVVSSLFAYFFEVIDLSFVLIFLLSIFLSFVAQIGDLVASKFKRNHDIKDYSNLFPGHGGILDRFDSVMFVSLNLFMIVLILEVI